MGIASAVLIAGPAQRAPEDSVAPHEANPNSSSVVSLVALPTARLAEIPIARLNLACAEGLSQREPFDVNTCLSTIQHWSAHIQSETQRHLYRFKQNPGEFQNSEGFFKMLIMSVVLAEDFNVRYDEQRRESPTEVRGDDGFFANPASVFLYGVLGEKRQGTCSSLPVLYVALGRQLGYPLKLVATKGHLFVRWDGLGER